MNLKRHFLPIGLLMLLPCFIAARQSREEGIRAIESMLLDVPGATYKLNASYNGRGYHFCNTSAVRVVKFRLGCAEKKNGELKILRKRSFEDGDLVPTNERRVSCLFWASHHGFFPGEACKKGKLAVIEVALADGTVWKLKP